MPNAVNKNNGNKLVRYIWNGTHLIDPVLILHPIPFSKPMHHGGAMTTRGSEFFLLVGNNHEYGFLQNLPEWGINYDKGVIYRIDFDGNSIPTNPFFSNSSLSKYFAYGIRNGYGIAVDPVTNLIWDSENGDNDFDEINLVFPGFNSGYQKIQGPYGKGEWSSSISDLTHITGSQYSDPKFSWKNSLGLTAIEFLNSKKYGAEYENDMFVGDAYGNLYRLELNRERTSFVFSDKTLEDLIVNTPEEAESNYLWKKSRTNN